MSNKTTLKPLAVALGAAFVTTLATTPVVNAADNPFAMSDLSSGYMVADGKEGKCGAGKMKDGGMDKMKEGKCGEGKMDKMKEGKCGAGKMKDAGMDKMKKEGKCGASHAKEKEGKCGGSK